MSYLSMACEKLGINQEQVLKFHERETSISLVVDNGIKGCPKYIIPLSDLAIPIKLVPSPEYVNFLSRPADELPNGSKLVQAGYTTFEAVVFASDDDLLSISGIGAASLQAIRLALTPPSLREEA